MSKMHPVKPMRGNFDSAEYVTGELMISVVSARNLTSKFGSGNVYVEMKTYEHNYEEDQFGKFALDESFQKCKESQSRSTKLRNVTSSEPFSKTIYYDEEKHMGSFAKGASHEIYFLVKQESGGKDVELGRASLKSDDFLDPFRPAKEVYLLLDDPPYFVSFLYLNVLFSPSPHTLERMKIPKSIPLDFDKAYDQWIIGQDGYVDRYGFKVSIGKYHPRLIDMEALNFDDSEEEEYKRASRIESRRQSKTPDKRLAKATEGLPALRDHNLDLKQREKYRPEYEEVFYHFRQMQLYLNNEAKAQANEVRQEYCWNDFLMKVTDNIHDMSEQGDDVENQGHMFSVANRSHWKNNSWQNEDIWSLCKLGISYNLRSRVWYDLLEVQSLENLTYESFKTVDKYDKKSTIYENLKHYSLKYYNVAFAQIDEDMRILDVSNTPSRDDRGTIKSVLKCFIIWQKV